MFFLLCVLFVCSYAQYPFPVPSVNSAITGTLTGNGYTGMISGSLYYSAVASPAKLHQSLTITVFGFSSTSNEWEYTDGSTYYTTWVQDMNGNCTKISINKADPGFPMCTGWKGSPTLMMNTCTVSVAGQTETEILTANLDNNGFLVSLNETAILSGNLITSVLLTITNPNGNAPDPNQLIVPTTCPN